MALPTHLANRHGQHMVCITTTSDTGMSASHTGPRTKIDGWRRLEVALAIVCTALTWRCVAAESADLRVIMTDRPSLGVVGNPILLSIVITNQGPSYATKVMLSTTGAVGQQTYSWPALAPRDSRFLVLSVGSESPALLTNSVFVSSDSPDPVPGDNQVELVSRVLEIYGENLIANPGAECPTLVGAPVPEWGYYPSAFSEIPGWWVTSNLTVNRYGAGTGFPALDSPGPPSRGTNFFFSGSFLSTGGQYCDLSAVAVAVDSGGLRFEMSAYLGGAGDRSGVSFGVEFFDGLHRSLKSVWLGPVTALDRTNVTALLLRSTGGFVPRATRYLNFTIVTTRDWPDTSFVDDLSFVLLPTESPKLELGPFGARGLVLSWPTNKTGYVLQWSSDMFAAPWTTVETPAVIVGDRFTSPIEDLTGNGFYRLARP